MTNALVPFQPTSEGSPSFVQRAIQEALDRGMISPDWLNQLELEIQQEAETMADERSRYPAPTEDEIRGAHHVVVGYLSFGLEQESRGQVVAAARIIASSPLDQLVRNGEAMFEKFHRRVRGMLDSLSGHRVYLDPTSSIFNYELEMELFSRSLEEIGRHGHNRREIERLIDELWNEQSNVEIGIVLLERFRRFFSRFPGATFNQCLANLAVNSALGKEDEAELTVDRVERFREIAVYKLRIKDSVASSMADWLLGYLTNTLKIPILSEWFNEKLWPELLSKLDSHFGGPQPLTGVIETLIVTPSKGQRSKVGASLTAINMGEPELAEHLMAMPKRARVRALGTYEVSTVALIIMEIGDQHKDTDEAARLLLLQSPRIIGRVLYHYSLDPEDVGGEIANRIAPQWVNDVVSKLKPNQRTGVKLALRHQIKEAKKFSST